MKALMQDRPLLISSLIEHADAFHPDAEIVSRTVEGPIHRYTYARHPSPLQAGRARRSTALGVKTGDRIGTLAWNGYRHLELYYGVSGTGAVLHTINPRLLPGADRLHRQPRRRPVPVLRPDVRAAGREARAADASR